MIFAKVLRENWWKFAAIFLVFEVNLALSIFFYPDFREFFDVVMKVIKLDLLKTMISAVGGGEDFAGYIIIQHFFKAINVLGSVGVVLLGMSGVAKEVENRTVELLLSRPVSRTRIYLIYYFTNAALICLVVFASSLSAWIMGPAMIGESLPLGLMLQGSVHATIFLWLLFSLTLLLSAMASDQSKVAIVSAGFFVTMFLIFFVQKFNSYSIYQWNDMMLYMQIHKFGIHPWSVELALLGGTAVFLGFGWWKFKNRDF